MRYFFAAVLVLSTLPLAGCGSILSSLGSGHIDDQPSERTLAQVIEDDNIETKVTVNLYAENEAYDAANIAVVSYNGYVLLAGQVVDQVLKANATKVMRKVKGVRRIYNELEIGAPSSALTRTGDTWITAKIKSALLTNSDVQGTRVKVVTENGVVFLMGLVTQKEAGVISGIASGVSGVTRVVRLFELVD